MKHRAVAILLLLVFWASPAAAPSAVPRLPYDLDFESGPVLTGGGGDRPALARSGIPMAVIADPPRHPSHPAANRQLVIPSKGFGMNALFLLASGPGPKPTMLLLHGLPGNERNMDLAQAVRRAGWNVLTFAYRGAWGSQGTFSVHHALDDTRAALDFLRSDAARAYNVDPRRLVLAGHSMGGFAAAWTAASEPVPGPGFGPAATGGSSAGSSRLHPLAGVVLLDAWDIGRDVQRMRETGPAGRQAMLAAMDDIGHSLGPITAADIADNLARRGDAWHLASLAPRLARTPVLTIYARHDGAAGNKEFADRLRRQNGAAVTAVELDSGHDFADKRIALAGSVVGWLQRMR
jgi:pimeloyl-ACP methyl ester carboxylesterase